MTRSLVFKNIFSNFWSWTNVLKYLCTQKQHDSALVLTYHRVIDSQFEEPVFVQPGMYVFAHTFRQQLSFLKEKFHVMHLKELVGRVESGKSVSGCCAITFDDGWHDNFTSAFPILQTLQLPATVFLATAYISTNRMFWPEELIFYLRQPEVRALLEHNQVLRRFLGMVPTDCNEHTLLDNIIMAMKTVSPTKRGELLEFLRAANTISLPETLLMNWQEVREMQASGLISFGSHTSNHEILDQVSLHHAEEEIVSSMEEIEHHLGSFPDFFAYPNGNYSCDLQKILKKNGFRGAVSTQKRWFGKDVNLFEIPRVGIHQDVSSTTPLFFTRILFDRF